MTIQIVNQRTCTRCNNSQPSSEFSRNQTKPSGFNSHCRTCRSAWDTAPTERKRRAEKSRQRYAAGPGRDHNYRRKFGITLADYELMVQQQRGVCAICQQQPKAGKRLVVDHDHVTKQVRRLLCSRCNVLIGWLENHPQILPNINAYLMSGANVEVVNSCVA